MNNINGYCFTFVNIIKVNCLKEMNLIKSLKIIKKPNLRFNPVPGGQEVQCGAWAGTCAWS